MAEAALRNVRGYQSATDRLLMSRPLRLVEASVAEPEAHHPEAPVPSEQAPDSAEIARLKLELMVLKAALQSERDENAHLRARITAIACAESLTPEARAVQDRWSGLVDRLMQSPR